MKLHTPNMTEEKLLNAYAAAPAMYEALSHLWEVFGTQMELKTSAMVEAALAQAEGSKP